MLYSVLAFLPFIVAIYGIVVRKLPALYVMPFVFFLTSLILFIFWNLSFSVFYSSIIRGVMVSIEIILIVISIIFLFSMLKRRGFLEYVKDAFQTYSSDIHVQIILLGWFLISFFEGIAGFGMPAVIVAPLLVLLGLKPITAVVLTLIANTVSVVFGAFGTPVVIGIEQSLEGIISQEVAIISSIISGGIGFIMPLFLLIIYTILEHKPIKSIKPYFFFALLSGAVFSTIYISSAILIGPELPSILAASIGLFIMAILAKKGILLPYSTKHHGKKIKKMFSSLYPYVFLITLFIITRANLLGIGDFLQSISFELYLAEDIGHTLSFYTPGALILLTVIVFALIYSIPRETIKEISLETFSKTKTLSITLLFTLAFVQLIIYSSTAEIPGIPETIGLLFSDLGIFYIFVAPFIGAFGSFIAGSATVSNLIFGPLQQSSAIANSLPESLILALQTSGAGAGNMIALHNILAVCALVQLYNKESQIIKINSIVVLLYCLLLGIFSFLLYFFQIF